MRQRPPRSTRTGSLLPSATCIRALRSGLPMGWRLLLRDCRIRTPGRALEAILTNKILVPVLFVVLVVGFLIPTVQFYSMLDWRLSRFMNWSVVMSGLLYWNLILDGRPSPPAVLSRGGSIISTVLPMVPPLVVGAERGRVSVCTPDTN